MTDLFDEITGQPIDELLQWRPLGHTADGGMVQVAAPPPKPKIDWKIPDGCHAVNTHDPETGWMGYREAGAFVVDGITYAYSCANNYARPMFQVIRDGYDGCRQRPGWPPTEEELDFYVRNGSLPRDDDGPDD